MMRSLPRFGCCFIHFQCRVSASLQESSRWEAVVELEVTVSGRAAGRWEQERNLELVQVVAVAAKTSAGTASGPPWMLMTTGRFPVKRLFGM